MRSVTVQVPQDITEADARLLLAVRLLEEGRVSLSKAAEVAGYGRRAFMEILASKGVASVAYPAAELDDDTLNA